MLLPLKNSDFRNAVLKNYSHSSVWPNLKDWITLASPMTLGSLNIAQVGEVETLWALKTQNSREIFTLSEVRSMSWNSCW